MGYFKWFIIKLLSKESWYTAFLAALISGQLFNYACKLKEGGFCFDGYALYATYLVRSGDKSQERTSRVQYVKRNL